MTNESLVYRLRKRAEIRRQIPHRKSVQEGKADRLSNLLEEAADKLEKYEQFMPDSNGIVSDEQLKQKVLDIWDQVEGQCTSSTSKHMRGVFIDRMLPVLKELVLDCCHTVSDLSDHRIPASEYSYILKEKFGVNRR